MLALLNRNYILRLARAALFALMIAAAAFTASPASAAVSGLQRIEVISASNSNAIKGVNPICPTGKRVIGAGGTINGPTGKVVLTQVVANPNLTFVTVTAAETGAGTTENWSVRGYAICANESAVPGIQQVSVSSVTDSNIFKSATARCPTGKKLLGAGASVGILQGPVALMRIVPDQTTAQVLAAETEAGTSGNWLISAQAICADSTAVPGLERVRVVGPSSSTASVRVLSANCPSGKKLISLGGDVFNASAGRVVIHGLVPSSDLTRATITAAETPFGTPNSWGPVAFAMCATP